MCFRLKLDHHIVAKCQTWVRLENQRWSDNMAGVCLQGPYCINLGDTILLICLLFVLHVRTCTGAHLASFLTGLLQGASVDWRSVSGLGLANGKLDAGMGLSPDNSEPECLSERGEPSSYLSSSDSLWGQDLAMKTMCCLHLLWLALYLH